MPGASRLEIRRAARGMMICSRLWFRSLRQLAKSGKARLRGELQFGVLRDLYSYVAERDAFDCAGDSSDCLPVSLQFVSRFCFTVDVQHSQLAVHLASIALAGYWFLARIAALCEADVRLVEARFGGEDALVDLAAPAGDAGLDPPPFELVVAHLFPRRAFVEDLLAAEDEP